MNAKKYNAAQKACIHGPRTFRDCLKTLECYTDLSKLTGKQIGEIINDMYRSCEIGRDEMYNELGYNTDAN